ncbi:MAG: disulfide bond formation protein DsbA [Nitrospira sp.]|nr:MAG: disulfide bond formation protein DsbA [Nitrospira sp.]
MKGAQSTNVGTILMIALAVAIGTMGSASSAEAAAFKGKYTELKNLPSTHERGKVKLTEFADFYCPHCHTFEQSGIPVLEQEFGDKLDVIMVGFPVIPGKLPMAFEMYEQAKSMGKGPDMKKALFRMIHKDHIHVFDQTLREMMVKEVGLDPVAFEAGLAGGKPSKMLEEGRAFGMKVDVRQTPTVLLDGNLKVESIDPENIKTIIASILDADKAANTAATGKSGGQSKREQKSPR